MHAFTFFADLDQKQVYDIFSPSACIRYRHEGGIWQIRCLDIGATYVLYALDGVIAACQKQNKKGDGEERRMRILGVYHYQQKGEGMRCVGP